MAGTADDQQGSQDQPKHGSETFFIEGEGLLVTALGGRTGGVADPMDESESPKAPAARVLAKTAAPPFRFSRIGPKGTALSAPVTRKLARAMVVSGGGDGTIPPVRRSRRRAWGPSPGTTFRESAPAQDSLPSKGP